MSAQGNSPVDSFTPPHVRLLYRLVELLDALLGQWAAYEADQARPPEQRTGVATPLFARESCLALRERYLAALANCEAGAFSPN